MAYYDPTRLLVVKLKDYDKYFDLEEICMDLRIFEVRPDKEAMRSDALTLVDELTDDCSDPLIPYLAVTYFDRFMLRTELKPEHLQLATICCLLLAWKMRSDSFSVHQFLTAHKLNSFQNLILDMETRILKALNWKLRFSSSLSFVDYFLKQLSPDLRPSREIVQKIIIGSLGDIEYTDFKPSLIAAAAIFTASTAMFPKRYYDLLYALECSGRVITRDLESCSKWIRLMCANDGILERLAGEASSSSTASHRPGKEPVTESLATKEVIPRSPVKEPMQEGLESDPYRSKNVENLTKNDGRRLTTGPLARAPTLQNCFGRAPSLKQPSDVPEPRGIQSSDVLPEPRGNQPSNVQEPGRNQPSDDVQEPGRNQLSDDATDPARNQLSDDVPEPGRNPEETARDPPKEFKFARSPTLRNGFGRAPSFKQPSDVPEQRGIQSSDEKEPGRNHISDDVDPGRNQPSDDVQKPGRNPEEAGRDILDSDDSDKKSSLCKCCGGAWRKT